MRMRRFIPFLLAALWGLCAAAAEPAASGVRVVVIDAGHGGADPGACYAGVTEKEVTLKVALALGRLIEAEMPGVKVVYTRTTDKALAAAKTDDLQARADVANGAGGDLFISIHCNAASRAPAARGVETLVMGESPKEQNYNSRALYENNRDDLIDMSDARTAAIVRAYIQNLQFTYGEFSMALARCVQNRFLKAGRHSRGIKPQLLRVLYATDMPGILTEIGFLSNEQERAYLRSEKGQSEVARSLFLAVKDYSAYVLSTRKSEEAAAGERAAGDAPEKRAEEEPSGAVASASVSTATSAAAGKSAAEAAPQTPERTGEPAAAGKSSGPAQTAAAAAPSAAAAVPAAPQEVRTDPSPVRYAVQVCAGAKQVPLDSAEFKSYRGQVRAYRADGPLPWHYCLYESATREEAARRLAEVRKVFPNAFVVRCREGRIVK